MYYGCSDSIGVDVGGGTEWSHRSLCCCRNNDNDRRRSLYMVLHLLVVVNGTDYYYNCYYDRMSDWHCCWCAVVLMLVGQVECR
jgi:hypothetical protein